VSSDVKCSPFHLGNGAVLDIWNLKTSQAYILWTRYLKHNPSIPKWFDCDRFVLSGGHSSMLLHSLLHLMGYAEMTLDQIKNFRQWRSMTPGYPERLPSAGIETTDLGLRSSTTRTASSAMAI
jgi:transketolase